MQTLSLGASTLMGTRARGQGAGAKGGVLSEEGRPSLNAASGSVRVKTEMSVDSAAGPGGLDESSLPGSFGMGVL